MVCDSLKWLPTKADGLWVGLFCHAGLKVVEQSAIHLITQLTLQSRGGERRAGGRLEEVRGGLVVGVPVGPLTSLSSPARGAYWECFCHISTHKHQPPHLYPAPIPPAFRQLITFSPGSVCLVCFWIKIGGRKWKDGVQRTPLARIGTKFRMPGRKPGFLLWNGICSEMSSTVKLL